MKRILLQWSVIIIGCFLIIFTGCSKSKKSIVGSGNVISQERNINGFYKILFNGNGNLYISQGEKESVKIEGEDNLVDLITTEVVDNTLRIDFKKSKTAENINSTIPLKIYIEVKSLQEVRLSGSGSIISTTPLEFHTLKLSISGSGSTNLQVVGRKLVSILSGSGNFVVKGEIDNQDIWISGSGTYQGEDLISKVANINITGTGKVNINVQDKMDIRISGAGVVIYRGSPLIHQSISGAGKIQQEQEAIKNDKN